VNVNMRTLYILHPTFMGWGDGNTSPFSENRYGNGKGDGYGAGTGFSTGEGVGDGLLLGGTGGGWAMEVGSWA
jgi:hypothetical protein